MYDAKVSGIFLVLMFFALESVTQTSFLHIDLEVHSLPNVFLPVSEDLDIRVILHKYFSLIYLSDN